MSTPFQVLTVTANPAIDQTLAIVDFAAGKVNRVAGSRMDAGGKGINVATILADLQLPVCVTGLLGAQNAALFERHFTERHLEDRFVRVAGETRTGVKIVNPLNGETTDINFAGLQAGSEDVEQLAHQVSTLAAQCRWTVLSGSLPRGVDAGFYGRLIEAIHAAGGAVALDVSGAPLVAAIAAQPEILKPNRSELEELVGQPLHSTAEVLRAATQLLVGRTRLVVISMGADGALFVTRELALRSHAPQVAVASTVGAGDAMVAGLVWAELQQLSLQETARLATAFGAYAVTRCGAGMQIEEAAALMQQVNVEPVTEAMQQDRNLAVQGVQ